MKFKQWKTQEQRSPYDKHCSWYYRWTWNSPDARREAIQNAGLVTIDIDDGGIKTLYYALVQKPGVMIMDPVRITNQELPISTIWKRNLKLAAYAKTFGSIKAMDLVPMYHYERLLGVNKSGTGVYHQRTASNAIIVTIGYELYYVGWSSIYNGSIDWKNPVWGSALYHQ